MSRANAGFSTPGIAALCLALLAGCTASGPGGTVSLRTQGGEAWAFDKLVTGETSGHCERVRFASAAGTVLAEPQDGEVLARVPLVPGGSRVEARCLGDTAAAPVAEQRWQVPLADRPKAWIRTVPEDGRMILDAGASEAAPVHAVPVIAYEWRAEHDNPAPLPPLPATGKRIALDPPPVDGEYHVTLTVTDAAGRSDQSTGVFRVVDGRPTVVDLDREHPAWVDDAVVYGVAPFFFGPRGLPDVTDRLDELAALGIDTLWLSPVTAATEGDFGYAVTDHFRVRPEFGGEAAMKRLVAAAHARGMRVIVDFVPNHVAAQHRYYEDVQAHGQASPYYAFFDRDADGDATHYFDWDHLINLNYDNPEVQRWMIEAAAYWLREFDIDGFRVDAIWGPRRRAPEYWPRWRSEMKRIKPDILLLAEASARDPYYYRSGFDVAYDWTEALGDWPWDEAFEDEVNSARHLRTAIAASQAQDEADALVFRFMNNNDTGARFVTRYGVPRTRLAAAMLLTLPGVPMIYTGQEVGAALEPYDEGPPIDWIDRYGLRSWYETLIDLRQDHPPLRSNRMQFVDVEPSDRVLAYIRPGAGPGESIMVLLNWSAGPVEVALPPAALQALGNPRNLVDILDGERPPGARSSITLPAHGVRIMRASGGAG